MSETNGCCSGGERAAKAAQLSMKLDAYMHHSNKHPLGPAQHELPGKAFELDGKSITAEQARVLGEVVTYTREGRARANMDRESWYFWAKATRGGRIPFEVTGALPRSSVPP